jgi:hypothetical protein
MRQVLALVRVFQFFASLHSQSSQPPAASFHP